MILREFNGVVALYARQQGSKHSSIHPTEYSTRTFPSSSTQYIITSRMLKSTDVSDLQPHELGLLVNAYPVHEYTVHSPREISVSVMKRSSGHNSRILRRNSRIQRTGGNVDMYSVGTRSSGDPGVDLSAVMHHRRTRPHWTAQRNITTFVLCNPIASHTAFGDGFICWWRIPTEFRSRLVADVCVRTKYRV